MGRKPFASPILASMYNIAGGLALGIGVLAGLAAIFNQKAVLPGIAAILSGFAACVVLVGIAQVITAIARAAYHAEGTELAVNALLPVLGEVNERLSALVVNNLAAPGGGAQRPKGKDAISCPDCGTALAEAGGGKMRCPACNQKYEIEG
jgi:hypothetical protein